MAGQPIKRRREAEERARALQEHQNKPRQELVLIRDVKQGETNKYTPEMAEMILDGLARGMSINDIGRQDGTPSAVTIRSWGMGNGKLAILGDFPAQFARAREMGWAYQIEEFKTIIDDAERKGTFEAMGFAKLRCDLIKWVASREHPEKWGDRKHVEHTGEVTHSHMLKELE